MHCLFGNQHLGYQKTSSDGFQFVPSTMAFFFILAKIKGTLKLWQTIWVDCMNAQ